MSVEPTRQDGYGLQANCEYPRLDGAETDLNCEGFEPSGTVLPLSGEARDPIA